MIARAIVAATLVGALAGCAGDNPPMAAAAPAPAPAAAAPAPAMAGGPVNGIYKGPATMTRNGGGRCAGPGTATFNVRNGTVTRRWNPTISLEAKVQPDGTFSTQTGATSMTGTLRGGHLVADIANEYCGFHYDLTRV